MQSYDKIRIGGLAALYAALAALGLLLGFATLQFWPAVSESKGSLLVLGLAFSCVVMFIINARTAWQFFQYFKKDQKVPTAMMPFAIAAAVLYLASSVFAA
ncbi:hypothetical protein GCM10017044_13070 [Kordiimonas sediminis]|uniref:Uncharacterized protein n=1 Tax=Kordiimonas sediminis TaxID=1735581 RepID=A0A919AQV6_9PROT|nr:hypothetical protein [Kordiimonas sediminis]GHF19700.1 hypothetical protein GCM10017044_13070 [Kordiimonas sediminis]